MTLRECYEKAGKQFPFSVKDCNSFAIVYGTLGLEFVCVFSGRHPRILPYNEGGFELTHPKPEPRKLYAFSCDGEVIFRSRDAVSYHYDRISYSRAPEFDIHYPEEK